MIQIRLKHVQLIQIGQQRACRRIDTCGQSHVRCLDIGLPTLYPGKNDMGQKIHEQIDLVALTWLGRGDGDIENWDELRAEAARAHNKRTAAYLLGMPMLADHLEEALSKFGHSSEEVEADLF